MSDMQAASGAADRLCSLAESQLQMQTARSVALDTAAIGVAAVDTAVAALVLASTSTAFWILSLSLVGLSATLAIGALASPGAELTGPSIPRMRRADATGGDGRITERLLNGFEHDLHWNTRAVVRKAALFDTALMSLAFAIVLELAGRL